MERKNINDLPLLLRPRETASLTGLSLAMVYKRINAGELPSIRIGKSLRVPRKALEELIAQNTRGGRNAA